LGKSTIIPSVLAQKKFTTIIYNFMIFVATKNGKTKKCSPSYFGAVDGSGPGSEIQDG
jgi:hypothetical protein